MEDSVATIKQVITEAAEKARQETAADAEPEHAPDFHWPVQATIGPGLEGAIACESKIGFVNGQKGWLIYRGYDIFDLCANATFEEVCYLLLHGSLPTHAQLAEHNAKLVRNRTLNSTLRLLMAFPVEKMNAMAALRLGTNLMRQEFTFLDREEGKPPSLTTIGADEDSIPMETAPRGFSRAIYEFKPPKRPRVKDQLQEATGIEACYHLVSGVSTLTAAIARIRRGLLPIEPDPTLSHAANLLYMMTGQRPTPLEERIMDVALILHADHGMNASTFAALVVASTLSDTYFSVGAGIAALNGPLHGGANEQVVRTLNRIGSVEEVKPYVERARASKRKIMGFGHRVYKAYDPRARILGPLVAFLARDNPDVERLYSVARALEQEVLSTFGERKKIFPNVDFYSGLAYSCLGISEDIFTPLFAASRVAGWTARVLEYMSNNRIFRPRAIYTGEFSRRVVPVDERE
jgi:citrate synthase